jgi:hypothetical protein
MKKSIVAMFVVGMAFVPDAALAVGKGGAQPPTGKARADQYAKVLKWCQTKYGGSGMVSVEWAAHYGKSTWWCRHRL